MGDGQARRAVGWRKEGTLVLSCPACFLQSRVFKLCSWVEFRRWLVSVFQSLFVTNIALKVSPLLTQRPRFSLPTSKDLSILLLGDVAGQPGGSGRVFLFFFSMELWSSWYISGPNGEILRGSSNSLSKEVNGLVPEEGFGVSTREQFWGTLCVLSDGSSRSF